MASWEAPLEDEDGGSIIARRSLRRQLPINPQATLITLPRELLRHIFLYINKSSALSLIRVSPIFAFFAEPIIWETITLDSLPLRNSSPLIGSPPAEAERQLRAFIKARSQLLLYAGNARRFGLVQEITIYPRQGCLHLLSSILDAVSPNLRSLHIMQPQRHPELHLSDRGEYLDLHLASISYLAFPSLSFLRLTANTILHAESVAYICTLAPCLVELNVSFNDEARAATNLRCPEHLAALAAPTALRQVEIWFEHAGEDPAVSVDSFRVFADLLGRSPRLGTLLVDWPDMPMEQIQTLLNAIVKADGLRHLSWTVEFIGSQDLAVRPQRLLRGLKRLDIRMLTWDFDDVTLNILPTLETIFCDCYYRQGGYVQFARDFTFFAQIPPPLAITASHATWLRSLPCLRAIHFFSPLPGALEDHLLYPADFDAFERTDKFTCYIRSITHGGKELLHMRMLLLDIEAVDRNGIHSTTIEKRIIYTAGNQSDVEEFTISRSAPTWVDFTDYEGKVVPLEVIRMMRKAEGVGAEDDWNRRGVQVGDEAWKVLTDWHEALSSGDYPYLPTTASV